MKTKHLLIALALPSLFAACTAEEFENGNDTVALKNRTPLGDITLDFGGNADTRLGLGDNSFYAFNWVDGDDLGASLIDTRNGTDISGADADHITGYNLTTTPQTNYRYEYNAGKWTSNAAMVEGNYVFYMPYVENTNREATMAVLPTTQTLEKRTIEGKDAYTTYNNVLSQAKENGNIMAVAYKFLTAQGENNDGNKSINITFKQLYATPMFTISNYAQDKDGKLTDLTIKKIELSLKTNAQFTVKSPLKYTSNASNTAYTEANGTNKSIVAQLNENLKADDSNVKVGSWVNLNGVNNKEKRATSDLLGIYGEEDATSAKITINLAEPVTVKKAENFSFYAVIPGGDYSTNNLIVTLTTTDNLSVSVEMPAVNINPGKRYAIEGYNEDGTVGTGADALFNVITEKLTESTIDGIPVATQAELLQTLATAQKDDNDRAIDMKIIPAEGVVLDNQIIAMLTSKGTEVINSVTFNGDMVINGLTNTTAVPVTINGKATLKGTVSAELVSTATANKIFVEKDITIDAAAKATLNGTAKAAIINNGELTVATALTATKVTNNKTLKLAADLTGTNGIINAAEGTINVTAASTLAGKLTNKGAVVVDKDKTLTTAAVDNEKTITVNGTLAMSSGAAFDNKKDAEIIVAGTLNDTSAASLINNGKITVNEGAIATMNATASINKNVIDNAGTLTVQKNSGTINMTNTSKFGTNLVTVSEKATDAKGTVWGTIMNPNGKTVDSSTLAGTTGQRVWKSKDAVTGDFNLAAENLAYNAVNFGANVKFTAKSSAAPSKFVYANFNGSTIKVTTTSTTQEVGMPLVVDIAGSVEVEYDGTYAPELVFPQDAELNIAKGAELGWTKRVDITGNSTSGLLITNKGTVYNHTGSSATKIDSNSVGVWAASGTTGNATNWKGDAATVLP